MDNELLARYDEWAQRRIVLSERETSDDIPSSNDWQYSDDDGCSLASDLADAYRKLLDEARETLTACNEALVMVTGSGGWTCTEANMLHELHGTLDLHELGEAIMLHHADSDDGGDLHKITEHDGDGFPIAWADHEPED